MKTMGIGLILMVLFSHDLQAQGTHYEDAYNDYLASIELPSEQAKTKLSYVKDYFLSHGRDESEVYVIVIIRDERWRWEQVYLRVMLWEEDNIGATLASKMSVVKGYPFGAEFVIEQGRVVDWLIVHEDGREEGNYIIRYLRDNKKQ